MTQTQPTRRTRRQLALTTALGMSLGVFATSAAAQNVVDGLPTQNGAVVVSPGGTALLPTVVTVTNARAVVNWQRFNVPENATATFTNASPATTAVVLNRVTTIGPANTTTLAGTINAVGGGGRGVEVWVSNPNGIIMGPNGNFNTQGFVATTLTFSDTDATNFVNNAAITLTTPGDPFSGITGAAGQIVTNGRVLAFIAPVIQLTQPAGKSYNAGAGNAAFVVASQVTINTPGSPLSMVIDAGTTFSATDGTALSVGGTVNAGNAYFVASAQTGINALLNVAASATTASAVNGIVVLGGGTATAGTITVPGTPDNAGGFTVTTGGALTANAGGNISIRGANAITANGPLTTVGGGDVEVETLGVTNPGDTVTIGGNVSSSGAFRVTAGDSIVLGTNTVSVTQRAAGSLELQAFLGTLSSVGTVTLNGDSDGSGDATLLAGGEGIDFMPVGPGNATATLIAGDAAGTATSGITFGSSTAGAPLRLGNVRAGTLTQQIAAGPVTSISRTGAIVTGDLTLSAANTIATTGTLSTGAVTTGAGTTTLNGNGVTVAGTIGNIGATAGGVTINAGTGAASLQDSDLAGALSVTAGAPGATFANLSGAGAKSVVTTGSITGTSIRGAGAVTLTGGVGAARVLNVSDGIGAAGAPVGTLAVNGGNATLGALFVTGQTSLGQGAGLTSLTVTGATDTGSLLSDTSGFTTLGAVRARTGAIDVASANAGITFNGAVDGPAALTVQAAPTASVVFNGAVGQVAPFTSITSNGGAAVALNAATLTTSGAFNIGGQLQLGTDATVAAGSATLSEGVQGNVGAGDHDLQLDVTGASTINGVTGVRNLTTSAAGTTTLVGGINTSGTQTYNDAVVLNGASGATVRSIGAGSAGAIVFNAAVDGPRGLTVEVGTSVTFVTAVGGATPLASLDTRGVGVTRVLGTGISTVGALALGPVALVGAADVTMTAGGDVALAGLSGPRGLTVNSPGTTTIAGNGGAAVAFLTSDAPGAVNISGAINGVGDLTFGEPVALVGDSTLTATRTVFGGVVIGNGFDLTLNSSGAQLLGTVAGVRNLTSDAPGTLALGGNIFVSGDLTFNDPVTLNNSVYLSADGRLVFNNTLGSLDETQALSTGSATIFNGDVGGAAGGGKRLLSLQTGATTLGGAGVRTVRTVGAQSYGALSLQSSAVLIGTTGAFGGLVDGGAARADLTLTFSGATTLNADPLTNIDDFLVNGTGPLTLNGSVTTFGTQTYQPALALNGPTVLTSINGGSISFATIAGGGQALTVYTTGLTDFGAGAANLGSLTTDFGGTTRVAGAIGTTGAQRFGDDVVLAADVTFASSGGGAIGFDRTITGPFALTSSTAGQTTFGGAVGATLPGGTVDAAVSPTSVISAGNGPVRINGGAIATSGAQSYAGLVELGANTVLTGTTGTFASGVNGNSFDLTLNFSGPTTIGGAQFTGVNNFTSGGGGTTALQGTISTSGSQTYLDAVTLTGATSLLSGAGGIRFASTLDGAQTLQINTAGQIRFDAAVGGTTALAALTVDGSGAIQLNGGSVRSTGTQRYTGAAILSVDTTLATDGGDIVLLGPVNGTSPGAQSLSVRTSFAGAPVAGAVTFASPVGAVTPLKGLAVRADSFNSVAGNRVTVLAAQVNGDVRFDDAGALTVGSVDGLSGIATAAGTNNAVSAGGLLTLAANLSGNGFSLSGTGVSQAAGTGIAAGPGAVAISGRDGALALNGTITTSSNAASAVRLLDAASAQLGSIQTGALGGVVLGGSGAGQEIGGDVAQLAGATITTGTLSGTIGGTATLDNGNAIAELGALSAGALTVRALTGLTVAGPVTTGTGPLALRVGGALALQGDLTGGATTLTVGGGITQAAGSVLTAASLTGTAGGGVALTGANRIGELGGFTVAGAGAGFALTNTQALSITGDVTVPGSLALNAPSITFTGRTLTAGGSAKVSGQTIAGGTINAGGDVTVTGVTVDLTSATAGIAPSGTLTVNATDALRLGDGSAGQTVALSSTNGPLTVSGGLTAGAPGNTASTTSVSVVSGGVTTVGSAISHNGGLTLSGGSLTLATGTATNGALTLTTTADGGALSLGTGAAGTTATLDSKGTLSVGSGVTSMGNASLTAVGAATVNAVRSTGGSVLVRGSAVALGGDPALLAAQSATALTIQATGGDAVLTNAAAGGDMGVTATGAVRFGSIGTASAPIGGTATVNAGGAITGTDLIAAGDVSAVGGGAVQVGTLSGATVLARGTSLDIINATATSGAMTLTATNGQLTLGTGKAGAATLTSSADLTVGTLTGTGPVSATAGGAATVGSISGSTLTVTGTSAAVGTANAGSTLVVRGTAGAVSLGTGTAGGAAILDAQGSGSTLGVTTGLTAASATLTATGAATIQSVTTTSGGIGVQAASANVANADARTSLSIDATAGNATLGTGRSGGDAFVRATGGVTIGTLSSGGALTAIAGGSGGLSLGTGTAATTATLNAAGPLTITTSLTSGGNATATATGAATIGAITSTNGAVAVSAASAGIADARAATTLDLTTTGGNLTLGTGNAGGAATLKSAETLGTTALTTGGAASLTASGAAMLGTTTAGTTVAVTAGSIGAGQTNAATTIALTGTGNVSVTGAQAGGAVTVDAGGTAALGQVLAGASSTIAIKATDAQITGTQRAGTVVFTNRAPGTVAFKLGDGTSTGGFALGQTEVNNVEAGQLTFDGGTGNVEFGALAFDADAGRTRVDVLTTGRVDAIGAVSGGGASRTFRLGGTAANTADRASVIRVVATGSGGGRLLFDTADLDLRGTRIGVGQAAGFLDPIGFGPGGTALSAGTVGANYVGNPNSSLYNATFGGALYSGNPTLVSARSLTVRFGDYALFQNTGVPGLNTGVVLGSSATPIAPALTLQGPGAGNNAFALFGSINGITGTAASVLGANVLVVTDTDPANTRVNGCLAGSGTGCLSAVVSQPLLNTFDPSRLNVFRAADDLALPFDPVIGGNNEALFSGFGLIDSPITDTQCSTDQTDPRCGQQREQGK